MTDTTLAFDTFDNGLSADAPGAQWFHVHADSYVADDGVTAPAARGGLHVASRGVNEATGEPAFSISLPQETAGVGIPATNDHAKWLAYFNRRSPAGYPGFEATAGRELAGTVQISGRTFGTGCHPFGRAVADPEADLRLSAFAMTTIDIETFMVFDFLFTNGQVYAFYERLPFGRSGDTPYAAFSYAIPVKKRTTSDRHEATIAYDRSAGVVRWVLDGVEVYRVTDVGRRLKDRAFMLIDLGGTEQTVEVRQLDFGMGLFTLLDGAIGSGAGLVRLSDQLAYYSPDQGEPHRSRFVDESSRPGSRLFGQGAEMRIDSYGVGYAPSLSRATEASRRRRSMPRRSPAASPLPPSTGWRSPYPSRPRRSDGGRVSAPPRTTADAGAGDGGAGLQARPSRMVAAIAAHSYRSASMGSSCAAFRAG